MAELRGRESSRVKWVPIERKMKRQRGWHSTCPDRRSPPSRKPKIIFASRQAE